MDTNDSYLDFRGVLVHYVYQFQFRKQDLNLLQIVYVAHFKLRLVEESITHLF